MEQSKNDVIDGGYNNYAFYNDYNEVNIKDSIKTELKIAVQIKNVSLSYGKTNKVLDEINMNVPYKQIYGLLGPSGCGKTSLLRCVIGIRKPDSGQILVYGHKPGTLESGIPGPGLGYTPQEVALFADFTIAETMEYFGKLFHMNEGSIKRRTNELIDLLNLPEKDRYISNLSGGQKRRVSLAVALIHSPPLLILDEPTVGVDPVLRKNIWDYMQLLTKRMNLTIIITTQYIEEARSADLVSFMRNGKLIAEKNPTYLLEKLNMPTLEAVFLSLCQQQQHDEIHLQANKAEIFVTNMIPDDHDLKANIPSSKLDFLTNNNTNVGFIMMKQNIQGQQTQPRFAFVDRIRALNWKNLTAIRRNLSMLIIQFLMPSFQCLLNFICLGPDPYDLPIAIYNADKPALLSGMFVNHLSNVTFKLSHHDSLETAINQVRDGLAWALLEFPSNYTRMMQYATGDDNNIIKLPQITLHLDTTNYVISNTIQKQFWITFNQTMTTASQLFNIDDGNDSMLQQNPFNYNIVYGSQSPTMSEFMAPGLISMAIFFAAMALTAITLVLERKDGIFERTLVAGVKTFEFVVSQISTQLLVLAVQVLLSIITMLYIIDVENKGSTTLIYLITLIQGMCGMALGLVVSAFSRNESQALALSMASFLPVSIISGIFWPVESMPTYMKPVSYFGPQTYALEAMRSVMSRGWPWTNLIVIYGLLAPSIWFILLVIVSSIGFHVISFR